MAFLKLYVIYTTKNVRQILHLNRKVPTDYDKFDFYTLVLSIMTECIQIVLAKLYGLIAEKWKINVQVAQTASTPIVSFML